MSKKRSWFGFIRKLFSVDSSQQPQQKRCKRKRWLFGRLRKTKGLPSLALPPPPSAISSSKVEPEEKQGKCEDDVPKPVSESDKEMPKSLESVRDEGNLSFLSHQLVEHSAAIKIQAAYRGYLARKALRALKGFVRLQAIIRGRAVRRQAMTTLKSLQAIVNIQSAVCSRRVQMVQGKVRDLQLQHIRVDKPEIEIDQFRRSDDKLLPKDEEIDIILRKKEAILRRQRSRAYPINHRHSADSEESKAEARLRYWLQQYVDAQVSGKEDKVGEKQFRLKSLEGLSNPQVLPIPRRSFHNHRKQSSCSEDSLNPSSPAITPTYMAATLSAKAKARSTSSPRLRPIYLDRAYSDSDSPYKHKLSPISSINSEVTISGFSRVSNKSSYCSYQQKSPCFKGGNVPLRSSRNLKGMSVDSEGLLVT